MDQHLRTVVEGARPAGTAAEASFHDRERRAWAAYRRVLRTLAPPRAPTTPSPTRTSYIAHAFAEFGVDTTLVDTLFRVAPEAWGALDNASAKVVRLVPGPRREVDAVCQGLRNRAAKEGMIRFRSPYERMQDRMDPANLGRLLDAVTTSWITLPRAYAFLQREDVHHLPAYLQVIESEDHPEVLRVFTRVAIEFLANYTIRFAAESYPRVRVARLVAAGYTALFWKNLDRPPQRFADLRICEHFLAWLRHSRCREDRSCPALDAMAQAAELSRTGVSARRGSTTPAGTLTLLTH